MESEPPDGIESAAGAAAAAAFLRPPPFLRPAAFFRPAPFFAAAFFFGAALRPAFFGAAFFAVRGLLATALLLRGSLLLRRGLAPGLLPAPPSCVRRHASPAPARVAVRWLVSLRCSPVGTPSRVVGCSRAAKPRPGRRSRVGSCLPRAPMPHMPGSATSKPGAHRRHRLRRICDFASDVDARSTVLHLDWSAVNGPSFRCRAHCSDSANRMRTHRIRYSLSRPSLSTKSNRFVASAMKKMRTHRNAMHRCHRKPPRHRCRGGVFSTSESLRRACRSARTTDFRGRCSSQSGESACCRCAVR